MRQFVNAHTFCNTHVGWYGCAYVQTYEGGLGGEPGNEAHGGYTFCGLAALMLVDQGHHLDLPRLIHWAVHMQVSTQGPSCPQILQLQ